MASYVNALSEEEKKAAASQQGQAQSSTPYTEALNASGATTPNAAQIEAPVQAEAPQQTATYIDESGDKQTGYVSVLTKDNDLSYWQRMEKLYNDQYEAAKAQNDAAAKAKYSAAMEQINAKIKALEDSYAGTNKQLYRDFMENQRVLPQQMAANGFSGGMTESGNIRLRNSYEEALAQNERSKAGQIADLNAQGVQYQYDADAEAARLNAEADQQRRSYLAALVQQEQEEGIARAREVGDVTGDYSGLLEYGYTEKQVQDFRAAWILANPKLAEALGYIRGSSSKSSGGRGGRGSGTGASAGGNEAGGNGGIQIDYASINNLGRGPISADYLSDLVESGRVTETNDNGTIRYSNNPNPPAQTINFRNPQSLTLPKTPTTKKTPIRSGTQR